MTLVVGYESDVFYAAAIILARFFQNLVDALFTATMEVPKIQPVPESNLRYTNLPKGY